MFLMKSMGKVLQLSIFLLGFGCREAIPDLVGEGGPDAGNHTESDAGFDQGMLDLGAAPADSSSSLTDPGAPGTPFGPKFGGFITVGDRKIAYLGTAAAVVRDGTAHFFGINTPGAASDSSPLKDVYLSFIFRANTWEPGIVSFSTRGIVGAYSFVEAATGHTYRLDFADPAPGSEFELAITEASHNERSPHVFYLRGKLKARLPNVTESGSFAQVDFDVNSVSP